VADRDGERFELRHLACRAADGRADVVESVPNLDSDQDSIRGRYLANASVGGGYLGVRHGPVGAARYSL
jgi:hypothetical protein